MKLFVEEAHSQWTVEVASTTSGHVASALTWVELRAGLSLKVRTGQIDDGVLSVALGELDAFWPRVQVVDVAPAVIQRAGLLAIHQGLRAYDAVQLSTARIAADGVGNRLKFCTFDRRLRQAAQRIGLQVAAPDGA